jgi:hypothetical protein
MIQYTDNSLPNGDFPNFSEMKSRHPDYQHFYLCYDINGYLGEVCKDEKISEWDLGNFTLKEKEFDIRRYHYPNLGNDTPDDEFNEFDDFEEVIEKHFGTELYVGYDYMSVLQFDTISDAQNFILASKTKDFPGWGEYVLSVETTTEDKSYKYKYDFPKLLSDLRKDKDSYLSFVPKDIVDLTQEYL